MRLRWSDRIKCLVAALIVEIIFVAITYYCYVLVMGLWLGLWFDDVANSSRNVTITSAIVSVLFWYCATYYILRKIVDPILIANGNTNIYYSTGLTISGNHISSNVHSTFEMFAVKCMFVAYATIAIFHYLIVFQPTPGINITNSEKYNLLLGHMLWGLAWPVEIIVILRYIYHNI
jgi:hypothetical protein